MGAAGSEGGPVWQGQPIGPRIHVIGNSCSGKSTLGARLATALDVPFVEIDAINWQPNWVGLNETNPEELRRRLQIATEGAGWVVAGSYANYAQATFWPRLETVVWLDLSMPLLVWRMLIRSWRRWRSKKLLWGTNYERFWPQLMVWRREESLLWWIVAKHRAKKRAMIEYQRDPRWKHIRFIRLSSSADVEAFSRAVGLHAST